MVAKRGIGHEKDKGSTIMQALQLLKLSRGTFQDEAVSWSEEIRPVHPLLNYTWLKASVSQSISRQSVSQSVSGLPPRSSRMMAF